MGGGLWRSYWQHPEDPESVLNFGVGDRMESGWRMDGERMEMEGIDCSKTTASVADREWGNEISKLRNAVLSLGVYILQSRCPSSPNQRCWRRRSNQSWRNTDTKWSCDVSGVRH